jgi:hypothetical protein
MAFAQRASHIAESPHLEAKVYLDDQPVGAVGARDHRQKAESISAKTAVLKSVS